MPLFGKSRSPAPTTPATSSRHARSSSTTDNTNVGRKQSMFSRNRRSSSRSSNSSLERESSRTGRRGLFGGGAAPGGSITAARESMKNAERAEAEAERSLQVARNATREAREHVVRVEKEAAEDARMAKVKQVEAKSLRRDAKGLGRV